MARRLPHVGAALAVALAVAAALFWGGGRDDAPAAASRGTALPPPVAILDRPAVERGAPAFAERYGPADHGGHRQSWGVVQAPSGMVYVANTNGLLEFDGTNWRLLDEPGRMMRAIAVGPGGQVYAGGEGTAGMLVTDSTGQAVYRQLIGNDILEGASVWGVMPTDRGVVVQTFDRLIVLEGGAVVDVQEAPPGRRFHKAFATGGSVYVRLEGAGLLRYGGGTLWPVSGGEAFADVPLRALFDLDGVSGGALLAVTDDELYRIDPAASLPLSPIPTAATAALTETRAYHGCALRPPGAPLDLFAVTTLGGGVIVLDREGTVVERLGATAALGAESVLGCGLDAQAGLWLALSDGIVRVDAAAPLTVFDEGLGLPGVVLGIVRYEGRLYAATGQGLFRLQASMDGQPARFEPVLHDGVALDQVWSAYDTEWGLLVATTDGLFSIDGLRAALVLPDVAFDITVYGGAVYAGLKNGLAVLAPRAGAWSIARRIEGIDGEIRGLSKWGGYVWASERAGRLIRIDSLGGTRVYDQADGVPATVSTVYTVEEQLIAIAEDGPYRLDLDGEALVASPAADLSQLLTNVVGDVGDGYGFNQDGMGRVWVAGRDRVRAVRRSGAGWADATPLALRRLAGLDALMAEDDVLWVGTSDGLYRLAEAGQARYGAAVPALLRGMTVDGGAVAPGTPVRYGAPVRFRFSAAAFNAPRQTRFRTQLLGHDEAPSPWSDEHFRDYTNLPPGAYAFRVEAQTTSGAAATPVVVPFRVPAPWYLTRWFAALAVLLGLGLVAGVAGGASIHHRRRADAERDRADELHRLNDELRRADRLKDHMLANTSHELRTPLTAILGYSELLAEYEGGDPASVRLFASHLLSGARRLLKTVNDVLDVAQLRAGRVELRPRRVDVAALAHDVAAELRPLAEGKAIGLAAFPTGLAVEATVDPDAVARVITNLVSNAIKFTDRGAVSVTIDATGGALALTVRDTGRGIAPAFLPRLFDAYEQESTGHGRAAEGNGLGLSITRQLVELMGGVIEVESVLGEGTAVHVTLPAELVEATSEEASATEAGATEAGAAPRAPAAPPPVSA